MRALKVIAILVAGPFVGFVFGALCFGLIFHNPNPAPGDGIGAMLAGFVTGMVFFVLSVVVVAVKLSPRRTPEIGSESE